MDTENARQLGALQADFITLEKRVEKVERDVRRANRGTDSGSFDISELKKKDEQRAAFIRTIVTDIGRAIALAILVWVAIKLGANPQVFGGK